MYQHAPTAREAPVTAAPAHPPRPQRPALNSETVPDELRTHDQWVTWRYEWREDRWTKVPYNPNTGRKASSTDPSTWATFDRVLAHYSRSGMDGIGFVVTADDPYVAVDLDDCIADNGELVAEAQKIVDQLDTYTEISPSGRGIRIMARGTLPARGRKTAPASKAFKAIETYMDVRFVTITGQHLEGKPTTIADRELALGGLYTKYWPPRPAPVVALPPLTEGETLADDQVLAACRLGDPYRFPRLFDDGDTNGNQGDDSGADLALCNRLARHSGRNYDQIDRLFRRSALMRPKWDEPRPDGGGRDGATWGAWTINLAIMNGHEHYRPQGTIVLEPKAVAADEPLQMGPCPNCAQAAQDIAQLRARVAELEALQARQWSVLQNKRIPKSLALTAIKFTSEYASARTRGQLDDAGDLKVYMPSYAEGIGARSPETAARSLKALNDLGFITYRVDRVQDQGGQWISRSFAQPVVEPVALLGQLARFEPEEPLYRQKTKDADGVGICCDEHPDAPVLLQTHQTYVCAEPIGVGAPSMCGAILGERDLPPRILERITDDRDEHVGDFAVMSNDHYQEYAASAQPPQPPGDKMWPGADAVPTAAALATVDVLGRQNVVRRPEPVVGEWESFEDEDGEIRLLPRLERWSHEQLHEQLDDDWDGAGGGYGAG